MNLTSKHFNLTTQNLFFIACAFLVFTSSKAQEKFTGNYEPYIKLEYKVTGVYSHKFIVEERINWYSKENLNANITQLDLAHFSTFKLSDKSALALGVQFRFEENFDKTQENELRFTEEYKYSYKIQNSKIQHRLRSEQRITTSSTSHRIRYKWGLTYPLKRNKINLSKIYVIANLETLLTLSQFKKPKYQQRIGTGIGWYLNKFTKLELVAEYRLDDFANNLDHELFLVTGVNLNL